MSLEEDRAVFAAVFQHFYLRLAVFFGCLGIFMNLFRGKMMDKTLHFWLLAPVRREVLLGGKYLAGLLAASLIFTAGALLCFGAMLWYQQPAEAQAFWQQYGASHALCYAAAAVLACVGYGSVFLAAGLLVRNPIFPAAVLLLWEGANPFLPSMLQKVSVLYYVQALCPVPPPIDPDMPPLVRLLFSPAAPPSKLLAVGGLLARDRPGPLGSLPRRAQTRDQLQHGLNATGQGSCIYTGDSREALDPDPRLQRAHRR